MRFGLLGTGYWAREVHAAGIAAHPEAEFVGVWGRDSGKASALGELYGVPAKGLEELLSSVDAVCIALPPDVQAQLAVRAAQAGCHLLLDKPVALSVEAADRLVEQVRANGLASVVFFTSRFQPATIEALDKASGQKWLGGRSTFFASIYREGSPYLESAWRREHGGLWDIGPHALAMMCPVLGPVSEVVAMKGPRQTTYVTLRHEGGAVSTMELTLDAALGADRIETVVHGESGWLTLPAFEDDVVTTFGRAIDALIGSVKGPEHPTGIHFGRHVVAVLEAAQESVNTGHSVTVGA